MTEEKKENRLSPVQITHTRAHTHTHKPGIVHFKYCCDELLMLLYCELLWIKLSAECMNINVNLPNRC